MRVATAKCIYNVKSVIQVKWLDEMPSLNQQTVSVGILKFIQSLQSLTQLCFV